MSTKFLLDNRDLQSCQGVQGKVVAITTPAQSTLCVLGHQAVPRLASGMDSMFSTQYLEFTAPNYNKLGFKYPSPEHNLRAFQQNYNPMKRLISVPEQLTSAPYMDDNEGLGTVHMERTFECWNGFKSQHYDTPGKVCHWEY